MTKKFNLACFIIALIFCSFIYVGFASLSGNLIVSGTINVPEPDFDSIVITQVQTESITTVNGETHYSVIPTNVSSTISGVSGQKVVYRITAHNFSKTQSYLYKGIVYSEVYNQTMQKMNVSACSDTNGTLLPAVINDSYVNGTPIEPGEDFVFYAVYTLTDNLSTENVLINFKFETVKYTITYLNDNEIWATDHVINNEKEYIVKTDGPSKDGRPFASWVNANAVVVTSYPAGNTNSYTLSAKWDNLYLIMFVDKDGVVLYEEIFSDSSTALSAEGQARVNEILASLNAEAALEDMSVAWSDYNISSATSDIVVRPLYTYVGMLRFEPVDTDGDSIVDYYKVVAVSKLKDPVVIPGTHQGKPVEVIDKLYKNEDNFDYGAGVKTITVNEGVKRLERNSLAYTADLETVYLPNSLEYIGKNAFSRNWSNDKKEITIYYNGTMAEWKKLVSNSHEDWANGITTRDGSRVMCIDGYFEYDHGFLGIGAKWNEHKY